MSISSHVRIALAALLVAGASLPASAQVALTQLSPGMPVIDTHEAAVGTISKLADGQVFIKTDRYTVPLDAKSFTLDHGKLYLGINQAQVNAFYEANILPAEQSVEVGKPIKGMKGAVLGSIKEIDDRKVVMALPSGQLVELPRSAVVGQRDGAVVGLTAADIAKQLGSDAAKPAPADKPSAS